MNFRHLLAVTMAVALCPVAHAEFFTGSYLLRLLKTQKPDERLLSTGYIMGVFGASNEIGSLVGRKRESWLSHVYQKVSEYPRWN